ncbi:MAG: valine--tRNA ligase [Candidatus Doudnabacteria bacterium]|nr:valine--tRNA ligase [Candidatus Doudnabacteria bacterium]
MQGIPKTYDQSQEPNVYKLWESSGYFNPDNLTGKPFTIMMPPPNVTGDLHVGHALFLTLQDIMIRFGRMRGRKTLWLPGTDHAAIATQSKIEADLYKQEGKTRFNLGREEFLKRVEVYAQTKHDNIVRQIRRMGASCDWSREAFTLDEQRSLAVRTAFKKMYDAGLIYRGKRIVNWDSKLKTTVSDDEVEWKDETASFYYLRYGPFVIGTARPETKFGDKYVVMHPKDKRYKNYKHGQKLEVEWINGKVTATVIKDETVDPEFGTGVMTITPWHDAADFEIAQRHNLDFEQIIDDRGVLLPIAGEFANQHIKKARPLIVEKLKAKGLLEKIDESYSHRVATNSRGGGLIEPQIKEQWFVDVTTLKEPMLKTVKSGKIKIIPKRFEKIYFHWIDNLRDWCISRQIWYGHQIPVWYKDGKTFCDTKPPAEPGWVQDPDTLDTWFSSGLWTFSTLGWPQETTDLKTFHPTDVLETGYDILFFWVARMILMSEFLLDDIPFRTVYLHGLIRDKDRQKMSKTKGNVIDPLGIIDTYGTDALRMGLIVGNLPGNDLPLSEDKVRGYRNFANKVWNAARFVLQNIIDLPSPSRRGAGGEVVMTSEDKKILRDLDKFTSEITKKLEKFDFAHAAEDLYHYFWHTFADKIIEESKPKLADPKKRASAQLMLTTMLETQLKLLHPFMPFVTEAIWQLTHKDLLMIQSWPTKGKRK